MLFHKFDPATKLYTESVEADEQPENSVGGLLPDQTKFYTLAMDGDKWVSVIRPEVEIVNGAFVVPEQDPVNDANSSIEGAAPPQV